MCFAVKFKAPNQQQQIVYSGKTAELPALNRLGEVELVRWGRDKSEAGRAFAHHCARLESIQSGKWQWLRPRAVNLIVEEFADWGQDGQVHWHVVPENHAIRGALIQDDDILRAYIVTEPTLPEMMKYSKGGRWPRIVQLSQ